MANKGQFEKGKTGNPRGRPKKDATWAAVYERLAKEKHEWAGKKVTKKELVARQVFKYALAGVPWAIKEICDRMDGKPIQQIIQENDTHVQVTRQEIGIGSKDEDGEDIDLSDPAVD